MLSQPSTATSSGTRTPRPASARIAPTAIRSLAQTRASTSGTRCSTSTAPRRRAPPAPHGVAGAPRGAPARPPLQPPPPPPRAGPPADPPPRSSPAGRLRQPVLAKPLAIAGQPDLAQGARPSGFGAQVG